MTYATPSYNSQGILTVTNPGTGSLSDGTQTQSQAGKHGAVQVQGITGRYHEMALRNNFYWVHSGLAGSVIKLSAATIGSNTFTLYNPSGSGVNLELVDFNFQQLGGGTEIVTQVGLAFQTNVVANGKPTTVTAGTINSGLIGKAQGSQAIFYTVATLTNDAIGSTFPHFWTFNFPLATTATTNPNLYRFDGQIIMTPGTLCTPVAAITGTEIEATITLSWCEWPV